MIHREGGELVAECTECGAEFAGGVMDDFHAFIADLKEEGWKIRKNGDDWDHVCPDCLLEG